MDLRVAGVGKNLQDHVFANVAHADKAGIAPNVSPVNLLGWLARWALTSKGPLASTSAESGGFVRTRPEEKRPNLQFHFLPVASTQVSFDKENFLPKGCAFSILPVLLYPKSRGTITLKSGDPAQAPAIDPRYFSDDDDMRVLVDGVRLAQRIARSKVLDHCRGESLSPL